jgi:hypothetical protein
LGTGELGSIHVCPMEWATASLLEYR